MTWPHPRSVSGASKEPHSSGTPSPLQEIAVTVNTGYQVLAREKMTGATVSMPVTWEMLEGGIGPADFRIGEDSIAELCRREGIVQNLYYRWSKEFLEAGKKRLAGDTARQATSGEVKDLRAESLALKEVVADLTLENRLLKATTKDNRQISLQANIELTEEVDDAAKYGAEGIGLYRSEFMLSGRSPAGARRRPADALGSAGVVARPVVGLVRSADLDEIAIAGHRREPRIL